MTDDGRNLIGKYDQAPDVLTKAIQKRKDAELLSAFGFASNLDLLCAFRPEELSRFLTDMLQGADPDTVKPSGRIENPRELAETILYYCRNGLGGEADLVNAGAASDCQGACRTVPRVQSCGYRLL